MQREACFGLQFGVKAWRWDWLLQVAAGAGGCWLTSQQIAEQRRGKAGWDAQPTFFFPLLFSLGSYVRVSP